MSTRSKSIPENIQQPLRERLKFLRESRGIKLGGLETFGPQTMKKVETEDISSMKLGDLYSLAGEFEVDFGEFLDYIFSGTKESLSNDILMRQRLNMYFDQLGSSERELAVDLIQRVMVHALGERATSVKKSISGQTSTRSGKDAVRALIAGGNNDE